MSIPTSGVLILAILTTMIVGLVRPGVTAGDGALVLGTSLIFVYSLVVDALGWPARLWGFRLWMYGWVLATLAGMLVLGFWALPVGVILGVPALVVARLADRRQALPQGLEYLRQAREAAKEEQEGLVRARLAQAMVSLLSSGPAPEASEPLREVLGLARTYIPLEDDEVQRLEQYAAQLSPRELGRDVAMSFMKSPPPRDEFAEALAAQVPDSRVDMRNFELSAGGAVLKLDRPYRDYMRAPESRRAEVLRNWAATVVAPDAPPATWQAAALVVVPRLRPACWTATANLEMEMRGAPALEVPFREIAPGLVAQLACESARGFTVVDADTLAAWGISFDEAWDRALQNLAGSTAEPFVEAQPGVFTVRASDDHGATRLLQLDAIRKLPLSGSPVVAVPCADALILTGSRDGVGLISLQQVAVRAATQSEQPPLVGAVFQLEGDRWVEWRGSVVEDRPALGTLRVIVASRLYAGQKAVLDRSGRDEFVAGFLPMQGPDGEAFSMSSWTEGVPTLLPRTDRVAFSRLDAAGQPQQLGIVPWTRVEQEVGGLMEPLPLDPVRYRVTAFPSAEELVRMGVLL